MAELSLIFAILVLYHLYRHDKDKRLCEILDDIQIRLDEIERLIGL